MKNIITDYFEDICAEQPYFNKRLNSYQKISINSKLTSEFYMIEINDRQPPLLVVPDNCIDIIFECDKNIPGANIFGSVLRAQDVPLKVNTTYFGVRFPAGLMPAFIDTSADQLINSYGSFSDLVHDSAQISEKISATDSFQERIQIFLNAYQNKLDCRVSPITEFIIKTIISHPCDIKIKDFERLTGYCTRHIQRNFKQDVGVSIKSFVCIMRFQSVLKSMASTDDLFRLSNLTYDFGYNDQAHLNKEFNKFIKMPPGSYMKHIRNY